MDSLTEKGNGLNFRHKSSWPPSVASLLFSALSLFLFKTYSMLHWQLPKLYSEFGKESGHNNELGEDVLRLLNKLLNNLEIYRIVAITGLIFAFWALFCRPRWLAWPCLVVSVMTSFLAFILM